MEKLKTVLRDESGASAAEYALLLSIIGAAIILSALALSDAVAESMNDAGNCISTTGASC